MLTTLYPALLFVHIVSALVLFIGEGVAHFAFRELRTAQDTAAADSTLARLVQVQRFSTPAPPLLLLSGLGLCALAWGFRTAWVDLSLIGFVAIAVIVRTVDLPKLARIQTMVSASSNDAAEVRPLILDPTLRRSGRLRYSLLLWLVFLMTVKPALGLALAVLAIMLVWAAASPLRHAASTVGRDGP